MTSVSSTHRPQRWDTPFGPGLSDAEIDRLLARPEFAAIRADRFPAHTPLREILRNDTRLVRLDPGALIVREGDYGNSAFLILSGEARVVLSPGLSPETLGRRRVKQQSWWHVLARLWQRQRIPEVRGGTRRSHRLSPSGDTGFETRVFVQDLPAALDRHRTALLREGSLFGELAALGRVPRTASMFAASRIELLEIRWQGLREIRRHDEDWRRRIDENYRANALQSHLRASSLFAQLDEAALAVIAAGTLFETYGSFDWHVSYKQLQRQQAPGSEPVIAREGDHADGLLLIRAGFARVTTKLGSGVRTLTYLGMGEHHGLEELHESWRSGSPRPLGTSLEAVGYVDVLRVPTALLEKHVFPSLPPPPERFSTQARRPLAEDGFMEWLVAERLFNGPRAMLIDLDRCTRCDDCVRACAATHDGNPRFVRQGKIFDHWQVTHACMHCVDPVCLIGCPTGAIHRSPTGGTVVINDTTCVGCSTCANSCPYDNIVMVPIRDGAGRTYRDATDGKPILKATKCDLCAEQPTGPACVQACPHDALQRIDFRDLANFQGAKR